MARLSTCSTLGYVTPEQAKRVRMCSLFILFSFQGSVCGVSPRISLVESVVSARQSDSKDNDLLQV